LLSELSQRLRYRREDRKPVGSALAELLEIRHTILIWDHISKELIRIMSVPKEAALQIRMLVSSTVGTDWSKVGERFDLAVTTLSGLSPVLAFRLRSKNSLPILLQNIRHLAASDEQGRILWPIIEESLVSEIIPEFDALIEDVAAVHGWRTKRDARRILKRKIEMPPGLEEVLTESIRSTLTASGAAVPAAAAHGQSAGGSSSRPTVKPPNGVNAGSAT
jgi:hypothetical protein